MLTIGMEVQPYCSDCFALKFTHPGIRAALKSVRNA